MKNHKALAATFALLTLVLLIRPAQQFAQAGRADGLREMLSRMEKILTRYGSRSVGGVIRRFEARDFRGCKITYELTPVVAPDNKGYVPFTERTTIDLSTLDPAGVVVREGQRGTTVVGFSTLDAEPKIEHRVGNEPHLFGKTALLRSYHLSLTNKAAAEELRETLLHAIELCKQ